MVMTETIDVYSSGRNREKSVSIFVKDELVNAWCPCIKYEQFNHALLWSVSQVV